MEPLIVIAHRIQLIWLLENRDEMIVEIIDKDVDVVIVVIEVVVVVGRLNLNLIQID